MFWGILEPNRDFQQKVFRTRVLSWKKVANLMTSDDRYPELRSWRKWTDLPLLVLAIGSLPLLLLEFVADRLTQSDRNFLFAVNFIVFLSFVTDYVVELILCKRKSHYLRHEWLSLFIWVTQLLALLPALGFFGLLRGARALRVLVTVSRLVGIGFSATHERRKMFKKNALKFGLGLSGFTVISSSVAFTLAEDVGQRGRIDSFFDALWWSACTVTTVGYGDVYPVTQTGRMIAIFTMLVGVSSLAIVTARIAQFLISDEASTNG